MERIYILIPPRRIFCTTFSKSYNFLNLFFSTIRQGFVCVAMYTNMYIHMDSHIYLSPCIHLHTHTHKSTNPYFIVAKSGSKKLYNFLKAIRKTCSHPLTIDSSKVAQNRERRLDFRALASHSFSPSLGFLSSTSFVARLKCDAGVKTTTLAAFSVSFHDLLIPQLPSHLFSLI